MRRCTVKDFEDRGITFESEDKKISAGFRLCPDMENMDYLKVSNGYTNSFMRNSFSLEILKCNSDLNPNCKPDNIIQNMLNMMMFNILIINNDQEIGNYENYGKSPLISKDTFHTQFKLNLDVYRDNNNFLVHNLITTNDSRYNFKKNLKKFEFLELQMSPIWIGPKQIKSVNISYD